MNRATLVVVALVVAFAFAGCGSSKKARPAPTPVDARGRTQVEVDAHNDAFTPEEVIVDVGTTVTWRNQDAVAHNIETFTSAADFGGPFGVDTSQFGPGATYTFTFRKVGTFHYTCTIHSLMNGVVHVRAGNERCNAGAVNTGAEQIGLSIAAAFGREDQALRVGGERTVVLKL